MSKRLTYITLIGYLSLFITVQAVLQNINLYQLSEKPHKGIKLTISQPILNTRQSLGDYNGDGLDDFVITTKSGAGISNVFVVYGNKNGIYYPNFEGTAVTQFFKVISDIPVKKATMMKDWNGDKIDDLLVSTATTTYVIYGSKNPRDSLHLTPTENLPFNVGTKVIHPVGAETDEEGASITSANFNGDDWNDIVLGFKNVGPVGPVDREKSGIVYIIFGGPVAVMNMNLQDDTFTNGVNGLKITGAKADDNLGVDISSVGDFNGDGADDLIIGAHKADPFGTRMDAGIAYVIYGKKHAGNYPNIDLNVGLDIYQGFEIYGKEDNNLSFQKVSGAGDVNGDGKDDIIVTAGPSGNKFAYVIFGNDNAQTMTKIDLRYFQTGIMGFEIKNEAVGTNFGDILMAAGDINGDNIDDIIVSSSPVDNVKMWKLYVIYGKRTNTPTTVDIRSPEFSRLKGIFIEDPMNPALLTSVSTGDVNGDGKTDLVITSEDGPTYVLYPTKKPTCSTGKVQVCKTPTF